MSCQPQKVTSGHSEISTWRVSIHILLGVLRPVNQYGCVMGISILGQRYDKFGIAEVCRSIYKQKTIRIVPGGVSE